MSLVALGCIALYGRNVPLAEDWILVPPLTGHEPDLAGWLWEQNNEHRLPVQKLLYWGLLELTGGDFRVGMVFNVVALSALSWGMTRAAAKMRGSETRYADAFFPVVLLHIGHWPNLVWSWQIQFVVSISLACWLLLFLISERPPLSSRNGLLASVCIILLPLTGASGLAFTLPLAGALGFEGISGYRDRSAGRASAALMMVASSVLSLVLAGLYFVNYKQPEWAAALSHPAVPTIRTAGKFLAFGLGPAASRSWRSATLLVVGLLLSTTILLLLGIRRSHSFERRRAMYLVLFLAGMAALTGGLAWGRAANPFEEVLPIRYVVLAVPPLCAAYFTWVLYGSGAAARLVQGLLLAILLLLLPLNIEAGFAWRDWYRAGMNAFQRDLLAGTPRRELARRHQDFLLHWDLAQLEANMAMLEQARIGLFRHLEQTESSGRRLRPEKLKPVAFEHHSGVLWQSEREGQTGGSRHVPWRVSSNTMAMKLATSETHRSPFKHDVRRRIPANGEGPDASGLRGLLRPWTTCWTR